MVDLYENIGRHIAESGRSVINVFGGTGPSFSYSIGNHEKNLPELLVFSLRADYAVAVINDVSDFLIERGSGVPVVDRELVDLGGRFPIALVNCAPVVKERFTLQATEYLQVDFYDVVQIVICDREGRFPWDAGCEAPFSGVPIFARPLN